MVRAGKASSGLQFYFVIFLFPSIPVETWSHSVVFLRQNFHFTVRVSAVLSL